jgi:NitT/TauT family transport system substrate-binding protein
MKQKLFLLTLMVSILIMGCATTQESNGPSLEEVRLLLPFRPDVQFAPFYVGMERGYFEDEGLKVTFEHFPENEAVALVGAGEAAFAVVSGEQVLLARAQDLPIVYVLAWWQDYPVAVAFPENSDIQSIEDLKGKKIGIPGLYGASYIGFRALIGSAGLNETDLTLDSIGYSQVEAMLAGQEDAVVVYANNEPVQLEAQGLSTRILRVADHVHLASNGLITNEETVAEKPELITAMNSAILKSVEATLADPSAAFEICKGFVEGLDQANQEVLQQVLEKSIAFWEADELGYSELESWENMQSILLEMGLLEMELEITQAFTNEFLP